MSAHTSTRPLDGLPARTDEEMVARARSFHDTIRTRRTVRTFSDAPIPDEVVELAIRSAATAPNGANRQPWHFVVVRDGETKRRIREAAEEEERAFYGGRAPREWLDALEPFGTDAAKPFLETAPVLIAVFAESWAMEDGEKVKNYYVTESVGIATGMLITALHDAGLATLTHTPSPMKFLNEVLGRPENERPFLLLVVGRPAPDTRVPDIDKKPYSQIATHI